MAIGHPPVVITEDSLLILHKKILPVLKKHLVDNKKQVRKYVVRSIYKLSI